MQHRTLGRTGIQVSAISFGAGPVSGLMTGSDADAQCAVVSAALEAGINWFDTAPGYGAGNSETSLGQALAAVRSEDSIHVATKVRVPLDLSEPLIDFVRRSVEESLQRLQRSSVTLLQLHNAITANRGDEPASISPANILGRGGVVEAFRQVIDAGLVRHIGLTGTGHPAAMSEVVRSGEFDTMQTPYNALNPSAGRVLPPSFEETNYGNILADCAAMNMGVFAIRVFAGGALLGQAPSAHTLKTPYFPLALYQRDVERARQLQATLGEGTSMPEFAVRFVLSHPAVTSALIGFGSPTHVAAIARTT